MKPCTQPEIDFYQTTSAHPDFAYYIPEFFGILSVNPDVAVAASAVELASTLNLHSRVPSQVNAMVGSAPQQRERHSSKKISAVSQIVMENVTAGLRKPNILDVKLGMRLWADDALPDKRQRLEEVAARTTSQPLGFRIAGMQTWMGPNSAVQDGVGLDGYKRYGKEYGRAFNVDTVWKGFEDFFFVESAGITRRLGKRVIKRFLEDLKGLQGVLEEEESRMYSSSLLFVYEGDGLGLEEDFAVLDMQPMLSSSTLEDAVAESSDEATDGEEDGQLPKVQAVKMIDFAHAAWTPGQGQDENVLHGIRSVIKILEDLAN